MFLVNDVGKLDIYKENKKFKGLFVIINKN